MHSCCYRHVVLGEYDVRRDPDCCRNCNGNKCAAKKIIRGIAEIIPYESYQAKAMDFHFFDYTPKHLDHLLRILDLMKKFDNHALGLFILNL